MPTTKRSITGKSSKSQPDFKRIKAKVGKRAPKPANVTDTSFKSASLHVRSQVVDHSTSTSQDGQAAEGSLLLSARGKSISELILQLNHPADAVRLSAMKGLGYLVQSSSSSPASLRPHLSILIPACCKSSVDEDEDVRQAGLKVLRELTRQQEESAIRPFMSLLVAYTTSALNSLDSGMRLDGARAVEFISTTIPKLVTSQQRDKLLPPYSGLVAEKHNKSKHSEEVLQSLVSLLATDRLDNSNSNGHERFRRRKRVIHSDPDLVYVEHGRGSNTLLLEGSRHYLPPNHTLKFLNRIEDLPTQEDMNNGHLFSSSTTSDERKEGLSFALSHEILSKLRDSLVETIEQGGEDVSTQKPLDVEKLVLLAQGINLVWNQSAGRNRRCFHPLNELGNDTAFGLYRLGRQITSLLLEVFPVTLDDATSSNRSRISELNGTLSGSIMDVASIVGGDYKNNETRDRLNWIDPLCKHLHECIQDWKSIPSPTLDVISGLLLLRCEEESKEMTHRLDLMNLLHDTFLANKEDKEMPRSSTGRRVAISVAAMVELEIEKVHDQSEDPLALVLHSTIKRLPTFLSAWRGDFLFESGTVIALLHSVVCCIQDDHHIVDSLRTSLSSIVEGQRKKSNKKDRGKSADRSILEQYPRSLQRKFVGLLVMLKSPSEATLAGLAAICERCNINADAPIVSSDIADFIVESVHTIRRTLSMQSYVGFLVSSTGLHKKTLLRKKVDEAKVDTRWVVQMDLGVRRICRALVRCGSSSKVLHMIYPVLSEWLNGHSASSSPSPTEFSLRARAAIAIVSMLGLDLQMGGYPVSAFDVSPQLEHPITVAYARMIAFPVVSEEKEGAQLNRFMSPMVALCQCVPSMLTKLLKYVADSLKDGSLYDPFARKNTLESLIELAMDNRTIQSFDSELIAAARSIEEALGDDGPTRQLSSRLFNFVEIKCGRN